ncbi:toxin-antitoxin system TumE family protein [Larkinella rosea]|uniref:Uncharacterized protein n=1 Tax=Larkinella rosea TaxID=2025312 RepID=A0A3P1BJ45_9BACT|nr:DUF6516 family protein [Larkinella rosea]RRB00926.1 hypothetical protein EHT25_22320 [Larkinella rosea]
MIEVIETFAAIISTYQHNVENSPGTKTVVRCQITFIDHSRLVTYESRKDDKFKYGYQWMNPGNETLFRWDNTPHFPEFKTYPFHRHIGPSEIAESFPAVSLADVLQFIADRINATSPQ